MKKILSLLLSVCLVLTMIPAISFAADGDQASGDGNVVPMGTQEEIVGEGSSGDPKAVDPEAVDPEAVDPEAVDPDVKAAPGDNTPGVENENDSEVVEEEPAEEGNIQTFNAEYSNQWVQDSGGWKYYNQEGNYLTGMQPIGGSTYYFNILGYLQTGLQTVDGKKYYFDPTPGIPGTAGSTYGVRKTGLVAISGYTYFFNPEMKVGWQAIGSSKYYFNPSNGVMTTGFVTINGSKYLFAASGVMLTGWRKVGSNARNSYFNPSTGIMQTGWAYIGGYVYYFNTSNGMYTVGWASIGGAKYYFDKKSGVMKTGWQKKTIDKKYYYYFYPSTGEMAKGWTTIGKKRYFFNTSNGRMAKGWLKYKKKKYFLTKSGKNMGVMVTGMKKLGGSYYFFNKSNGAMKSNGCEKVSKKLYYFFKNGKARWTKGWFKGSDKKKRYCLGKGVLATGKKKIGSNWYIFSKTDGTVTKSLGDDLDQKVQSKSSATRYLIAIKRSTYEVRVYTGSKNNWTRAKKFKCAIGAAATPTKTGTYTISNKGVKNTYVTPDGTQTRYWYWCYYTGTQGVHSGLYYDGGPNDGRDYDTRVGVKSTNGGVRVDYSNAKWIYNNVPLSTTVVVY